MTVEDADRERVIAMLREQAGEGRLDLDEFGARLDEAYQAQSVADLNHALRELPVPPLSTGFSTGGGAVENGDEWRARARPHLQHVHRAPDPARLERASRAAWGAHLGAYLSVNVMLIVIWLLSGAGYFWPIWPIMGWGIGIAAHGMAHGQAMRAADRRRRRLPPAGS